MPTSYTLRMQFGPHQDPQKITHQLEKLVQEAPINEIMFFFFGEEQNDGHDTLERIQQWIDRSRPYRQEMHAKGIKTSLNPWHSMLHTDRGRVLKPGQNWQLMIDPNGKEATAITCFLDTDWQQYYFETLRRYANEGFRVVWIDDDIRYHNHHPLDWGGCFCPLHVEEFNRRTGNHATREEIVRACLAPGEPHPWRSQWMDMWQDTILSFLNQCRKILNAGGTEMGLMSSEMGSHMAEGRHWDAWWKTFGGGKPPVHRPHFWGYSNVPGQHLLYGIAALDQNRSIQPDELETGPEIENFPYGQWNKSYRQTFAQLTVAQVGGSTNQNISMYDFMGNDFNDVPERVTFLKNIRPNLDWLADQFPLNFKSVGVGVPWSEDMGRTIHTEQGRSWFELQCPSRGWTYWLGAAGIAFSVRPQDTVNAIAGQAAWGFNEATLKQWLAKGLLLDGKAAEIFIQRGLGKWIGANAGKMIDQNQVLYAIESCDDPTFAYRAGAQISVNERPHTLQLFQGNLVNGVKVISSLLNPLQKVVGHGAWIYTNELGGRVAVVPWDASAVNEQVNVMMDIHRSTQLHRLAAWLAGNHSLGRIEGSAWLIPQFMTNGVIFRGAVWNAGPDEVDTFTVKLPEGMPAIQEAWHLTWKGERFAVPIIDNTLQLERPMYEWDVIILI